MSNDIIKITYSYCRSNAYLVIGICLGLGLSLLFAPNDFVQDCTDDCGARLSSIVTTGGESSWLSAVPGLSEATPTIDEYEPKINIEGKPRRAQKTAKAFVRPRYYSTELGIRDKIFVGVITGREYLHSRGLAFNKTLAHLVDRVRYFISVPEGTKPNITLPGIVGFTDTRSILKPFHVMKYITDNYLEDYDFYYIVKDSSYVNGRRLIELVERISVGRDLHLGVRVPNENYCTLDAGILLSNSLIRGLKTSLDWCVKNTFSSSDDVNFGRCVLHATNVACSSSPSDIHGETFRAFEFSRVVDFNEDFGQLAKNEERLLSNAISIYPIYDHRIIYKINAYFVSIELKRVEREISSLRRSIVESSRLGPEKNRNVSWPVGNESGNIANGRFDVLPWIYFNDTHSFMEADYENFRETIGSAKMDLTRVLEMIKEKYESSNGLVYKSLINGYRKFDASRGIDYILDLEFIQISTRHKKRIVKRIQVCKPLGKVEILPVPYVTENSRINMILVVDSWEKTSSLDFIERYGDACMANKDKTFLMIVLLYEADSTSKGANDIFREIKQRALELTDKYKKDQSKVTWLSVRLPTHSYAIRMDPMLKIAVADLVTKKFTPESMLLFVESRMDLKAEYLNRVRMNTICQWQIYSPIPFVEYDPEVVAQTEKYLTNKHTTTIDVDVNRNAGRYDRFNYESISFYVKDYTAMRRRIATDIPQVRTDKDIATILGLSARNNIDSIFQLFVSFSNNTHAFRAVEPALKIRYANFNCDSTYSENVRNICEKRRYLHLGHRGQLAKLILDYHNDS